MKRLFAGFAVTSVAALTLLAGPGSAAAVICPPPPCEPSTQIVCPLDASSASGAIAIVPCGCPIVLEGASLPVPYGCADLAVTARVDRATAAVGDVLTYTIDVRNGGPDTATDTTVVDPLPAGLAPVSASGPSGPCPGGAQPVCALGALGPGEAASATVVARAVQPGELANVVTASTAAGDLDPSNNQATATTQVTPAPPGPGAGLPRPPKPPKPSRSTWCSPSGDVCFGRLRGRGPIRLGLTLAARYFRYYRLCVAGPNDILACRRFAVHRTRGGTWGSIVRWDRRFPDLGKGTYQAVWSSRSGPLGPAIAFRR